MKIINMEEYLWVERYRPQCIEDLIAPKSMKDLFNSWKKDGEIPSIGLFGSTGLGKGSIYNALLKELSLDFIEINGSKDNGIDVLRTTIGKYATSKSSISKVKVVILDESDNLSPKAQAGLRHDMEAYSSNARFILTGNYKEKIIPAVLNRLQMFDLDEIFSSNQQELKIDFFNRLKFILDNENIEYSMSDLAEVVKQYYPSARGAIHYLQKNSTTGKLILTSSDTSNFLDMIAASKKSDLKAMKRAVKNLSLPDTFYSWIWKNIDTLVEEHDQLQLVPVLAEFQDMNFRALNKEIPLIAFLLRIQGLGINWKI